MSVQELRLFTETTTISFNQVEALLIIYKVKVFLQVRL